MISIIIVSLLTLGIGAVVVFSLLYLLFEYQSGKGKRFWKRRGIPSFGNELMGNIFSNMLYKKLLVHDIEHLYKAMKSKRVSFAGTMEFNPVIWMFDLDIIKRILVKDFDSFVNRRSFPAKTSDPHFHELIIFMENQEWKDLRSTISPTFTTGRIREMFHVFLTSGDRMVTYLKKKVGTKGSSIVNMSDTMGRLAMDVIAGAAFGIESKVFDEENPIFAEMGKKFSFKFTVLDVLKFVLMNVAPSSLLKKLNFVIMNAEADAFFTHIIKSTLRHRETSGEKRNDFIQLMLTARAGKLSSSNEEAEFNTGGKKVDLSDDSIVAQSLVFILGGYETVLTVLHFATYILAFHPEKQDKLAREIHESMKRSGGVLTYEDINHLEYLDKFVSETLRIYPPGILLERTCTQDYVIPGTDSIIPKGTTVEIPIYSIHHDPEYYPDPEIFDPERFTQENKASRHPYSYMPFGQGPRNCIAMRFALVEVKVAVATLVHHFVVEPTEKTPIPSKLKFTNNATNLRTKDDFFLKIQPRV